MPSNKQWVLLLLTTITISSVVYILRTEVILECYTRVYNHRSGKHTAWLHRRFATKKEPLQNANSSGRPLNDEDGYAGVGDDRITPAERKATFNDRKSVLHVRSMSTDLKFLHHHDYQFTISTPGICNTTGSLYKTGVFLLVLVESKPENFLDRNIYRKTWGSIHESQGEQIRTLFLLGTSQNRTADEKIEEENRKFRDIIRVEFVDTYRNLTLKTILGLRWVLRHCPSAFYVMKTDDDVIVQYPKLVDYLLDLPWWRTKHLFMGRLYEPKPPERDPRVKGYVSEQEYPGALYPAYLAGSGYVMSMDTVRVLHETSRHVPLMPMEDVYLGICANKTELVQPQKHENFTRFYMGRVYSYCLYKGLVTIHAACRECREIFWNEMYGGGSRKKPPSCPMTGMDVNTFCYYAHPKNKLYSKLGCDVIQKSWYYVI
ncbi:beta-1,3-galactosyltransferase 5-like [Lingula anatina]|uniref:Hexosyltransferase n=1 Tax=Lingula anatina TaxID=7574 RepID=A0A1S3JFV3_LINAN|nr:beta-1,3-galactosyltransferase 5-like [Lingula anatina]|eukprot:XP_013409238.1 beta-1,3-galactosyltransferase 5-like [Lingula anatina]